MKYCQLPKWAQKEAKETYKKWVLQNIKEAREAGEDVKDCTERELEEVIMSILTDKDDFEIETDDEGGNPKLIF